jgi:transcriptional regulator with XRE-family HTH domain
VNRFQRLVEQRLDERDWTLNQVASRGGLNRSTVYRLMGSEWKRMPSAATLDGLSKGLELPLQLLKDTAAESVGIRVYDEPASDPDTRVVIATMERLSPAERRRLRKMVESMFDDSADAR